MRTTLLLLATLGLLSGGVAMMPAAAADSPPDCFALGLEDSTLDVHPDPYDPYEPWVSGDPGRPTVWFSPSSCGLPACNGICILWFRVPTPCLMEDPCPL